MTDDLSLFDERLRGAALYSLAFGLGLGALSVLFVRMQIAPSMTWAAAIPLGLFAALALYLVSYRNYAKRLAIESP